MCVNPGHSAITLTPVPANSVARLSENTVTQALAAEYEPMATKLATDDTLMIAP